MYGSWFLAALAADKASGAVIDSDVNRKWLLVQQVYGDVTSLIQVYYGYVPTLPRAVTQQLTPIVRSIDDAIQPDDDACPKYCFDLSDWRILDRRDPRNACVCDLSRFESVQPYAHAAWKDHLSWALLCLGLAFIGMSWLAMNASAHLARTLGERDQAKAVLQSRSSSGFGYNPLMGSAPGSGDGSPQQSASAPAGHPRGVGNSAPQPTLMTYSTDVAPSAPPMPTATSYTHNSSMGPDTQAAGGVGAGGVGADGEEGGVRSSGGSARWSSGEAAHTYRYYQPAARHLYGHR